jgi:hypothetical protein
LLEHFAAIRDEESFAALVRRHGAMVLNVCRRTLANDADAEDGGVRVVQACLPPRFRTSERTFRSATQRRGRRKGSAARPGCVRPSPSPAAR